MTSAVFAMILALSPTEAEAQDANLLAAKPDVPSEEQVTEPKIHEPEEAMRNFHHLLKKGKLTLPGIVIEDLPKETK